MSRYWPEIIFSHIFYDLVLINDTFEAKINTVFDYRTKYSLQWLSFSAEKKSKIFFEIFFRLKNHQAWHNTNLSLIMRPPSQVRFLDFTIFFREQKISETSFTLS